MEAKECTAISPGSPQKDAAGGCRSSSDSGWLDCVQWLALSGRVAWSRLLQCPKLTCPRWPGQGRLSAFCCHASASWCRFIEFMIICVISGTVCIIGRRGGCHVRPTTPGGAFGACGRLREGCVWRSGREGVRLCVESSLPLGHCSHEVQLQEANGQQEGLLLRREESPLSCPPLLIEPVEMATDGANRHVADVKLTHFATAGEAPDLESGGQQFLVCNHGRVRCLYSHC